MKTHKLELSNSPQMIPLSEKACTILVTSEERAPFEGIIASQSELDDLEENKGLNFKTASAGIFNADFIGNSSETWYLVLKSNKPTSVTITKTEKKEEFQSLTPTKPASKKRNYWIFIIIIAAVLAAIALFFFIKPAKEPISPLAPPPTPTNDFMEQINMLPEI